MACTSKGSAKLDWQIPLNNVAKNAHSAGALLVIKTESCKHNSKHQMLLARNTCIFYSPVVILQGNVD